MLNVDTHMCMVNHKLKDPKGITNSIKFVLLLDFSINYYTKQSLKISRV